MKNIIFLLSILLLSGCATTQTYTMTAEEVAQENAVELKGMSDKQIYKELYRIKISGAYANSKYSINELREEIFIRHPDWSQEIKNLILGSKIQLGMTTDQAFASWGYPEDINRTVGSWGTHEQWVYSSKYLYFENGVLTSWQD